MSPVSGAADLERKNAYWIEFGKSEERERIIKLLEERILPAGNPDVHSLDSLHNLMLNSLIARIKGENK